MGGSHTQYAEAAETTRTTVRFPTAELEQIEALVEEGKYLSTSEAVRHAVRDLIEHHDEASEGTR
jgi:Arc/MetJ-type ribon-helix-helix transcriptional regulator